MSSSSTPRPDWYPDPRIPGQLRYWDGNNWTQHTAAAHPRTGQAQPGSGTPGGFTRGGLAPVPPKRNWFLRNKVATGLLGLAVVVFVLIGIAGALGNRDPQGAASGDTTATASDKPSTEAGAQSATDTASAEPKPIDTDGDGVTDDKDLQPRNPKVQSQGDIDTDRDGVPDFKDAFPRNAKYSKDSDGDHVADALDDFPTDARYSQDTDGDGVANAVDAFPSDPSRSKVTLAMENALAAAKQYLDYQPFSRQGLIDQLSSRAGSGFKVEDATWAVGQLHVDWREQAIKAAKQYLKFQPFSRRGLIDQLSSSYGSQFTLAEATYAANKLGLH